MWHENLGISIFSWFQKCMVSLCVCCMYSLQQLYWKHSQASLNNCVKWQSLCWVVTVFLGTLLFILCWLKPAWTLLHHSELKWIVELLSYNSTRAFCSLLFALWSILFFLYSFSGCLHKYFPFCLCVWFSTV